MEDNVNILINNPTQLYISFSSLNSNTMSKFYVHILTIYNHKKTVQFTEDN